MQLALTLLLITAFFALIYATYQLRENSLNSKRRMYLDTLAKYTDLRRMVLDDSDLRAIYKANFDITEVSLKQRSYIHILIAFCEGLYLTKQINTFKNVAGGNWKNFIRHTLSTPAVRAVWDEEARQPSESDYADDFIAYASSLLT